MIHKKCEADAATAPALAEPNPNRHPSNRSARAEDTRVRVPAELLPPDRARRFGYAILVRRCPHCAGYAHLFRSAHYAASYARRPPCGGPELVLVVGSVHLREEVAA